MDSDIINTFVKATVNVLGTMAGVAPVAGAASVKSSNKTRGVVTGLIGMAGEGVSGSLMLSFERESILRIVSNMLMEEFNEITPEVIDAVGELTNVICGGTKSDLAEVGYILNMATPITIPGQNVELSQHSSTPIISIPFTLECGIFWVEAILNKATVVK